MLWQKLVFQSKCTTEGVVKVLTSKVAAIAFFTKKSPVLNIREGLQALNSMMVNKYPVQVR